MMTETRAISYSDGRTVDCVIEVWDDLHEERAGYRRAFWVPLADIERDGTGSGGSPVIGYCDVGGSHRTIASVVLELRRRGFHEPVYRLGRRIA